MAYDYRALLENVHSVLGATSTVSTLVASMSVDYPIASDNIHNRIKIGDPSKIPTYASEYPSAYVELIGKEEEFSQLGTTSIGGGAVSIKRDITTSINITAFVYKQDGSDASDKQVQTFARNIETIFRSNTQVDGSDGWDTCLFTSAQFADAYLEGAKNRDGVHLSAVKLEGEFFKAAIS
jgi:hypothetical protein